MSKQNMTKIVALNRKRGNLKEQITKLFPAATDEESLDIPQLEAKLEILKTIQAKFELIKEDYYKVASDDEYTALEAGLSEIDLDIQNLEVRIKTSIIKKKQASFKVNDTVHSSDNSNSCVSNKRTNLQPIPLPVFTGRIDEFNSFKSQFLTLIHENKQLTDNEKLFYLKGSLKGEAKTIETADDNYESLFKALEQRYENERLLVDCHIKSILNLPSLKHESFKDLRNLLDCLNKNLRSLKVLKFERDKLSNVLILNIILDKLDRESRKQYELTLKNNEVPDFDEFLNWLDRRCQVLSSINSNAVAKFHQEKSKSLFVKNNSCESNKTCVLCKKNHPLWKCDMFLKQNENDRFSTAKKFNLCLNCLSSTHKVGQCYSKYSCSICGNKHNFLLHRPNTHQNDLAPVYKNDQSQAAVCQQIKKEISSSSPNEINKKSNESETPNATSLYSNEIYRSENEREKKKKILLATCIVYVENSNGVKFRARAILDSGSEISFISTQLADLLQIKKSRSDVCVSGINGKVTNVKSKLQTIISNKDDSFRKSIQLFVIPKITEWVPAKDINVDYLKLPKNIELADPDFGKSAKIDILMGAELFYEILGTHKHKLSHLIFQQTVFGYIASGTVESENDQLFCGFIQHSDILEENIEKFWKMERVENESPHMSVEEQKCESHFLETYRRDDIGRFVVTMPLKEDPIVLGDSKRVAEKRLHQLWNRLEKTPMREPYCNFMKEYENLGHMRKVKEDAEEVGCYYLPHHGVYRPDNPTTKIRVVFNASSPTTSGKSLNDILLKGLVSEELYDIMIRFRKHRFVILVDIEKMFRQVMIEENQRKLLRILWKTHVNAPVEIYELNTVTYGTSCAPFLAIRVLKQLAVEAKNYSKASEVLLNDSYMDDIITGEDSLDAVKELQFQLIQLLNSAGMRLHKWKANHVTLLENVNAENQEGYSFLENETKALGVSWKPNIDVFTFKVKVDRKEKLTKRTVLSDIARLFDPLGLIGPVLTKAKTYMQELWKLKLDWNDPIPDVLAESWTQFTESLKCLENLHVSRYVLTPCAQKIYLFGFADASTIAFGAAVYIQSTNHLKTSCHLVSSKSQVAPLKTISVPRLELAACLLLAKLVVKVLTALKLNIDDVYLYTDSQIALAWIETPPWKLKTFVANRVAKIQEYTRNFHWNHVSTNSNPADLISRGLNATELVDNRLWWHGPEFLLKQTWIPDPDSRQLSLEDQTYQNELKKPLDISLNCTLDNSFWTDFLNLSNNYVKLIFILSYIFRFISNAKGKNKLLGQITNVEFDKAKTVLIKAIQVSEFKNEIEVLKTGESLKKGQVSYLNCFLDKEGLLRVGGRLTHANISYSNRHQIILPKNHKLTTLIFQYLHLKNFHAGPQSLLHFIRQEFWPIGGKNLARKVVHDCVICFKHKPTTLDQLMGDLPPERVNPSSTFGNTGVDFCGPFYIRYKHQRKGTLHKVYVAIFVCLATKAIHLEIVFDLTSQAFIACLKRFFSRRGKSSSLFSDNSQTYIGTNLELKRLASLVKSPDEHLTNYLVTENISWKFIPPRAPNFGGLWEAGVKSFKHHLKRTVGDAKLFYEEFLTVVTQIEGILNSRPISPLSSDALDFEPLTPGHFLIGRPINSIPEPQMINEPDNKLSRWQRLVKMVEQIWKRWSIDYLNHLQQRKKWRFSKNNVKENSMVLIKDDNLPPFKWNLGRISEVIPGKDGKVRVVIVRTKNGNVKRPISKICLLPMDT